MESSKRSRLQDRNRQMWRTDCGWWGAGKGRVRHGESSVDTQAAAAVAESLQSCLTAARQAPRSLGFSRQEPWVL